MITRFQVQNYKALRDVTLELTPIHVLIGPNDSGKTSILEAIAALCRSIDHPLNQAFMGDWKGLDLVWRKTDNKVSFHVSVVEGEVSGSYQCSCSFDARPNSRDVQHLEKGATILDGINQQDSTVFSVTGYNIPTSQEAAKLVEDSLSGVQVYRWNPYLLALPVAPDPNRRFRMDVSGFGLALCLDDILGYDWEKFANLEDRFRKIFPHIKRIRLVSESAYHSPPHDWNEIPTLKKVHGKGIYFEFEGGHQLPAAQVSDGVLLVLAYLTILYLPPPYQPRVILVEEPENGMHPKRLQEVLGILRELVKEQSKTQVILTTHSPYVLDLFEPEEVSLCQMGEDGAVSVHRLSESQKVKEQAKIFTLGEIWTAEGDEALAQ